MTTTYDWRFYDEVFNKRSSLMSSLIRNRVVITSTVYEFCDFTLSQGWSPLSDQCECDNQTLEMYRRYLREVRNDGTL